MNLRVEFLLLLTLCICSYSVEQPGKRAEERETTRKSRQFQVGMYPSLHYGQQPASYNIVYNHYKRPSLTERFKTLMSKLFGRRSYVQHPYLTPQIQYYYKPYTAGNQFNIPTPQDQNYFNQINPQLSNSLYPLQVESAPVNGNIQTYELGSLSQPAISDSELHEVNSGSYVDFEPPTNSASESVRFPSNTQYYRSGTYPVQGSHSSDPDDDQTSQFHTARSYSARDSYYSDPDDVSSSQSHNAYVNTFESSSLDFSPVAVPSITNHSPVYKNPGLSGLERKSYTGNPVYED
ncbi:uncharacterized protein LOC143242315 [Tachypleus tridentatus]|uniref:uncharacterized protein LOC143242315 n=1 Tax=Tachypleus tridentatus TaxID=6853 RepID=UPI003FD30710